MSIEAARTRFGELTRNLPTLADRPRCAQQKWDLPSRADENQAKDRIDENKLAIWRTRVVALDRYTCRCCGRLVKRILKRLPERAEAHHVEGRENPATRYDVRNGLTLCLRCHKRVTGMVADKLRIIGTRFFTIKGTRYINARERVEFRKVA